MNCLLFTVYSLQMITSIGSEWLCLVIICKL